jgi:hypothetical protein
MRGEGYEIGTDPEEENPLSDVVPEDSLQTVQVLLDGPDETIFRVGGEAEGRVGRATDAPIDAGIPDPHRGDLRLVLFAPA